MIELRNITKTYGRKGSEFTALDDVSLSIPSGTSVAIVGKSGSGKSTLMHAMTGLDRPQQGEVLINGENILKMNAKKVDQFRAHTIGFVFQQFFVQANESCTYNVSLPLEIAGVARARRKELINQALAKVDLADKTEQKAGVLSGGQKQRLAIARAIVNNPSIIFADEPTGNLDSATGQAVEDLLFGYNREQNVSLVIVTHDHDLAKRCDMRIHIKDGRVERIEKSKV